MVAVLLAVSSVTTPVQSDQDLKAMLEAAGHTVTYQLSTTALPNTGYDCCVVTESGSASSAANTSIPTCSLPVVHMETNWSTTRMSSATATNPATETQIVPVTSHPIIDGLGDPITVTASGTLNAYGVADTTLPAGVVDVAETYTVLGHVRIAVADTGATLTTGTAPNRRVEFGLGIGGTAVTIWSANTDTMFVRSVEWAANVSTVAEGSATGSWSVSGSASGVAQVPTPTGLSATPVSATEIALDWNDAPGASGYDIERDGSVIVYGHAVSNYNDTGLTPSTTYTYRVRTVD